MIRGRLGRVLVGLVAIAVAASACTWTDGDGGGGGGLADRATLALPDLTPGPLDGLSLLEAPDGTRLLFFSSSIENVGPGTLRLVGGGGHIEQVLEDGAGREARTPIVGVLQFGQDGSERWLLSGLLSFQLTSDDGAGGRTLHATAYAALCVYDATALDGVAPAGSDDGCGNADGDAVDMRLSPGYRVDAPWFQPGQSVDMTGLADGRYRLEALVYSGAMVAEADRTNNRRAIEFEVRSGSPSGPQILLGDEAG